MSDAGRGEQRRFIWTLVLVTVGVNTMMELVIYFTYPAYFSRLFVQIVTALPVVFLIGFIGSRMFATLLRRLEQKEAARLEALNLVEYLAVHNALLHTIARTADLSSAFQTFARRIIDIVPCDRVGLALLKNDGEEFETFTARVGDKERRGKPRPEIELPRRGTVIGAVATSLAPRLINDLAAIAPDFLDANVLASAGFRSSIIVPLIFEGRAIGTLNLVSRRANVFTPGHVEALLSIGEIVAVAFATRKLETALARGQMVRELASLTFSVANDINSALQTIVGHCDLLTRKFPDAALASDLATISGQTHRVADLLKRLQTASERVRAADAAAEAMSTAPPPERSS